MSEGTVHLWPQAPLLEGETYQLKAILELRKERKEIWFAFSSELESCITGLADAYLLAVIFTAMRYGGRLHIHGAVSRSLLANLEEFQAVWSSWVPDQYRPVELHVDDECERIVPTHKGMLLGFSGGVDSSFSLFRHTRLDPGRRKKHIQAALFIHGFDMALSRKESYVKSVQKLRRMTDSVNIPLIEMSMNLKSLGDDWEHAQGAALAACMHALAGGFCGGIIASSYPYIHSHIQIRWGSNPITDPLLSANHFRIVHDGAEFTRYQKIQTLCTWPQALENVRVCLRGLHRDKNCCRCQKCIRVILYFRLAGAGLPPAFEKDVGMRDILAVKLNSYNALEVYQLLLDTCRREGRHGLWVQALRITLLKNRLRYWLRNRDLVKKGLRWIRRRK